MSGVDPGGHLAILRFAVCWRAVGIKKPKLYMRGDKDRRGDDIVKRELLAGIRSDGFDPKLAIDDRRRVVDMWRSEGLVCAQVAEGEF